MSQALKRALRAALFICSAALLTAACGGAEPTAVPTATTAAATPTPGGLEISVAGNSLAFDKASLSASAGASVSLSLHNKATTAALQHNWVLVKKGSEEEVVNAGANAGTSSGYVPTGNSNVIAHTKMVDGGKSDTLSFTVPAAGSYTYICSFPGHYAAGMKGDFTSK